jgi:threonine dehydrogenase-like Zn-dependent dehydrogenase
LVTAIGSPKRGDGKARPDQAWSKAKVLADLRGENVQMKGVVFLGQCRAEVREFPTPKPGIGEVLLRVEATGICGSDLHVYRSETATEQIRGHEPSGTVEEIGPGVVGLKPGDRVSVHHHQGCGVCAACARGETVACPMDSVIGVHTPGSFAQYIVVKERNCVPLPPTASVIDGAFMACVGGTAYAAYRRLETHPHESVAVFGLGPVGLSCVLIGKTLGLRVIGVDLIPERREVAARCGADAVVDAATEDVVSAVRGFAHNTGDLRRSGVDHVIETSGATQARANVLPCLRWGGKAAIVGVGSHEKVINPSDIHARAATIIGSVVFPLAWMWELASFVEASGLTFEPAVTHRFPIDEAPQALQLAHQGECGKIILLPHA